MKDLIIIGAGNVGGFLALNQELFEEKFNIIGFLDDDEKKIGKKYWSIPVLSKIADIINYKDSAVVIGISNPTIKRKIVENIGEDFYFPSFIARNAWVSNKVFIGKGVLIYPNVSINHESEIHDFSIINMNCAIGHNSIIGRGCTLAPGVNFAGFTRLDDYVEIGIGVSTIQQTKIGEGAVIGGQSMLITNVEKNAIYVGVPAVRKN